MKDEKLEIRKKPQEVKKEDLEKVAGGGDIVCQPTNKGLGGAFSCKNTGLC